MASGAAPGRVAVLGVGALGCLFAARLAEVAEVVMVGRWREQLAALRQHGLTLVAPEGTQRTVAVTVAAEPAAVAPAPLVLVVVKSYQTAEAAPRARQLRASGGLVLTLQNGLGNLPLLAAAVGAEHAALGVTSEGAYLLAPGQVCHAGRGVTLLATTAATAERLAAVAELFRRAGLDAACTAGAGLAVWGKLAVNAGINPLAALLGLTNGAVATPPAVRLAGRAAAEVAAVARAGGVALSDQEAAAKVLAVCQATAGNRCSMLQDLERGRPTEIDAIAGAVVEEGRRRGVATPLNELLWRLVKAASGTASLPPQTWPDAVAAAAAGGWCEDVQWLQRSWLQGHEGG